MPDHLLHIELTREETQSLADVGTAWGLDGSARSPHVKTGVDKLSRALNPQPEQKHCGDDRECTCDAASAKPSLVWHQPDCPLFASSESAEQKHCGGSGKVPVRLLGPHADELPADCPGCTDRQPGKPTGVRCESCDREQHVGDEGWESRNGLNWCPDCFTEQPHQEAEEDWPEVTIWLQRGARGNRSNWGIVGSLGVEPYGSETRRYLPAPTQVDDLDAIQLDLAAVGIDAFDKAHLKDWATLLLSLEGDGYEMVPKHPNQGEGSGERPREITDDAKRLANTAQLMEYAGFRAATAQIVLDAIAAEGEEVVPIPTAEIAEKLTEVCPECEGDDSGGGIDEPPSAMASCTCVWGRVPKGSASPRTALGRLAEEFEALAKPSPDPPGLVNMGRRQAFGSAAQRLRYEIASLSPEHAELLRQLKAAIQKCEQFHADRQEENKAKSTKALGANSRHEGELWGLRKALEIVASLSPEPEEPITLEQARMRVREAFETSEWPQSTGDMEYFIRRAFPDPEPQENSPKWEPDTHESRMEVNEMLAEADAAEPQDTDLALLRHRLRDEAAWLRSQGHKERAGVVDGWLCSAEPEEKTGADLIAAERQRQVSEEGWTPEHDDKHDDGELAQAAAAYALVAGAGPTKQADEAEQLYPFEDGWKPDEDEVRNLVKAGALIAAEIDRLQRLQEGQ